MNGKDDCEQFQAEIQDTIYQERSYLVSHLSLFPNINDKQIRRQRIIITALEKLLESERDAKTNREKLMSDPDVLEDTLRRMALGMDHCPSCPAFRICGQGGGKKCKDAIHEWLEEEESTNDL